MDQLQLETLTQLGEAAVQSAIADYTKYYYTSAICWTTFGCIPLLIPLSWFKHKKLGPITKECLIIATFAAPMLTGLFIMHNLPILLNPKAYAIQQLLNDI